MRTADCGPPVMAAPTSMNDSPLWYNKLSMRKGGIYETETRYTYIVFGAGCDLGRFWQWPGFF